ncbi:MAG: hypothetical protein IJM30_01505, partial [Thermoguttaceae bacterium]|nr:hypothetical protein [Thermoguttaceae bacterium]
MTIAENYWNKRGYSSRRGVFATFALAFALSAGIAPARIEAAPQESEAAPAAETPAEPPAPPTDEQRQAALERIGVENASEIPNPVDDPAAAAAFSAKMDAALANPTPPAPEPSVAVELAPSFDPKKSYSRLLYPAVATRVGLSEEQKRRINELMSERAQKLGKATKEEWNNITLESEKALEAVLTPEQNDRFKRGTTEKTIVFHFSKERWVDVLNWIAGECGLQLVMNAPPQGTFTYSDKTPYAPKDALDVLNSSLTFKGYTLFRYNDMLILHDFHTGSLPLQYLPKITPEDLPNQNKFDYVALTIPLERRNMAAVRTTIAPFMGPYCTLRSQGGNSLMVVDTVNALREIYAAAMSVHNPDPTPEERERIRRGPGQNNPPTPPETPTWRAYELEGISYQSLQEQIEVFAPSAKPLYNPQSDTLHYLAVPSVLNVIDGLVEKLKEGADPAKNAIVKTYSLDPVTPTTGPEIWAVARRLGGQQGGGGGRFGGGFPMQFSSDAREELYNYVIDSLSQIAPDARIELSGETRKLFVVANEADHAKIAATLESLAVKIDPEEEPVIKIYRVKKTSASSSGYFGGFDNTLFIAMRTTAPLAQTIPTSDGGLMVIATAKEQEAIAAIMKEFEASVDAPDQQNALKVYAMTARQVERFMQIYDQIASTPDMDGCVILPDWYIPTRFAVWAKPSQQAQIAKLIDQVVNAEAYVEADVEPKGLPEPQEPEKPAEPAPAPAPEQPAEPAPAPAPEKPAEPAPAPAPEQPAEPAPA